VCSSDLISWLSDNCPDIIMGWNLVLFDIPYIVNRIVRVLGESEAKRLSPWGIVNYKQVYSHNKSNDAYEIVGISQIDYMDVFKKFGYTYGPQESYSLDNIADVILGERKLSYEEHGNLHTLYAKDPQKFLTYNLKDVELVNRIDEETCLLDIVLSVAYKAGCNYKDTLGTVGIWDAIVYRKLIEDNVVVPFNKPVEKTWYPGGYVKDPHVGLSKWVVSFDLNSLYPSIIVQNNMSPECIVTNNADFHPSSVDYYLDTDNEFELRDNHSLCANGVKFRKGDPGVLPAIVIVYDKKRKAIKLEMLKRK